MIECHIVWSRYERENLDNCRPRGVFFILPEDFLPVMPFFTCE